MTPAHQGGWDETLLVAIPLVLFGILLWIAKRRAEKEAAQEQPGDDEPAD